MDTEVIATRLQKLDDYVRRLQQLQQITLDEYIDDETMQAVVERWMQLSIQACMDVASYLIAELGLRSPDDPENVFATLGQESIISPDLARRMTGMVRFRNILVHDYLEIDSEIVYRGLTTELDDFQRFAREIADRFLSNEG